MQYMASYGLNNGLSDTSSLSPWLCHASACAELSITAIGSDSCCILRPPAHIPIDPVLIRRYQQLFRFYDVQGDGRLSVEKDHRQAAEAIAARWQGRRTPFPRLLELLLSTYQYETERRDFDHSGDVDEQEFIKSHEPVIAAFEAMRQQAEAFIDRSAGGFAIHWFDLVEHLRVEGLLWGSLHKPRVSTVGGIKYFYSLQRTTVKRPTWPCFVLTYKG